MAFRVKIIKGTTVRVGRGLIQYKEGWTGPVKEEVYNILLGKGEAVDASPKKKEPSKKKASPKTKPTALDHSEPKSDEDKIG